MSKFGLSRVDCSIVAWTRAHIHLEIFLKFAVAHMQEESTIEGESIMRMTRLDFDEPPAMAPGVNVVCHITPDSPLWGKTYWDLKSEAAAIYVSVSATDNQHFQEVFARKFYLVQVCNRKCLSMSSSPNGTSLMEDYHTLMYVYCSYLSMFALPYSLFETSFLVWLPE
jgi:hypothetical protein